LICFPYRSFVSVLAITAGVWDKLIFAPLGSIPSLAAVSFQTFRNVMDALRFAYRRLRAGVVARIERLVQSQLAGDVRRFHQALQSLWPTADPNAPKSPADAGVGVRIAGADNIIVESERIVRTVIEPHAAAGASAAVICSIVGAGLFWVLLAGPMVAIYRSFWGTWWRTMADGQGPWAEFPAPPLSLIAATLILSAAPALVLAILSLGWCCRPDRVKQVVDTIRDRHSRMLSDQLATGALRIDLADERLEAARFLVKLCDAVEGGETVLPTDMAMKPAPQFSTSVRSAARTG
jgi:hypothetical protein